MKVLISCSRHFFRNIPNIKKELELKGHKVHLPSSYDEPSMEEKIKTMSPREFQRWKEKMMKEDKKNIKKVDALFVLNFEKKGIPNYIGGATFLETYIAWELGKKIFLYNNLPNCSFTDELKGLSPKIINGDLSLLT